MRLLIRSLLSLGHDRSTHMINTICIKIYPLNSNKYLQLFHTYCTPRLRIIFIPFDIYIYVYIYLIVFFYHYILYNTYTYACVCIYIIIYFFKHLLDNSCRNFHKKYCHYIYINNHIYIHFIYNYLYIFIYVYFVDPNHLNYLLKVFCYKKPRLYLKR